MKGPGIEPQQLVTRVLPTVTGKVLEPCAPVSSLSSPPLITHFPLEERARAVQLGLRWGLWGGGKRAQGSAAAPPVGLMKEHPMHSTELQCALAPYLGRCHMTGCNAKPQGGK